MGHLRALSSLLFVLLIASSGEATPDATCKAIADGRPDMNYDYCMKFFQADPASATADARGLAAIAARLAKATAAATGKRAAELEASEKDKAPRGRLDVCVEIYSGAVDELGEAAAAVAARRDQDALTLLSAALDAASTCEDAFGEANDASPLADEDAAFAREAALALAVAASLLSSAY